MDMKLSEELERIQNCLPEDIALQIVSSLQVSDVCSLGTCSRFWRALSGSDSIWAGLCRERWPALDLGKDFLQFDHQTPSNLMGWKGFYVYKHQQMASKAATVIDFVRQCLCFESVEVVHYLTAIEDLCSMQFGFKDVQMLLLKPQHNVLLNMVAVHYCVTWLGVPADYIMEALENCNISERQVSVRWWKLGRMFYGFRMQDESHCRTFSLGDLATAKEDEVLGVLHRGAIHEVLRVQISVAKPVSTPWSSQSAAA